MSIIYSIDKDRGVVFTTASGGLTDDELLAHKQKLTSDPDFAFGMVELTDGRQISDFAISSTGIRRFVAQDASDADVPKNFKLAIVVTEDVAFGMARMYEMMTSENVSNVRVFRDLEEAEEWLGIST